MYETELTIKVIDGFGDESVVQERPFDLHRPCECGCDYRGNPDLVGYLHGISDGRGFSILINDEDIYQLIEATM